MITENYHKKKRKKKKHVDSDPKAKILIPFRLIKPKIFGG